ncbi:MAG TPA: iron uptake transporter deferrochelatase/peroxidase subunit, partial [Mycobacteriales bacterium]|nr:iron uptake transporter deferrochelatase/peroxidase subunit [Mycobacteriales bacterium]
LASSGCGPGAARPGSGRATVPFHGEHQAGVATPTQDRLVFAAFDVTGSRAMVAAMLRRWTTAAERMTAGHPVGGSRDDSGDDPGEGEPLAPPVDTGEAAGLPPSRLTLTVGLGPSLFDGRFGLAARRPAALADLPPLPGDELDPARSGGDLCVQACADDPQVAFHAVRNLARIARGTAHLRWLQLGFGRTSTTSDTQSTPRNLMGFKDGTNNIHGEDTAAMNRFVWVAQTDQPWMAGGSYLVVRRIRMLIESWDRASLGEQERVVGRRKSTGAPLGRTREADRVDLTARDPDGDPVVPADAHIRLAAPAANGGERILRRGYSYTDGADPLTGELDAGLFFACFQRDPRRQFVPIQRRLGAHDAMTEYIKHTGSAVFACPPGLRPGQWWAQALLG